VVKFFVVEGKLAPTLSCKPAEKRSLITVNYERFESVSRVVDEEQNILERFLDVFNGDTGALP